MTHAPSGAVDVAIPVLLRHARAVYAASMRAALDAAGFSDLPSNGPYLIGGLALAPGAHPLSQLIGELGLSKQAAGQLVETLVDRGYLDRSVDPDDRRRLNIAVTRRGRSAARVLAAARATIDQELLSRVGEKDIARTRRVLLVLAHMGRERAAEEA